MRKLLDVVEAAVEYQPKGVSELLKHAFWVSEAAMSLQMPYVIKGIIGPAQITVCWGAPGSGKTFVVLEASCAVGSGQRWHGRRTTAGTVLYVLAESSRPYAENRIAALKRECPTMANATVLFVPLALDLLHGERGDVERVIDTAKHLGKEHAKVSLIVVDTLAVTFGGGDENKSEDMGAYVANIKRIVAETGAAVVIVHHCGKDEAKGMRGHTALLGALDAELVIEMARDGQRILRTGKVRDGDAYMDLFAFRLRPVELGTDQDGEAVRTCVVESLDDDGTRQVRQQVKATKQGKHQRAILRALESAGGRMVRTELMHKLKDEGMPRNRVHDAIASLLEAGMVVAHSDRTPPEVSLP